MGMCVYQIHSDKKLLFSYLEYFDTKMSDNSIIFSLIKEKSRLSSIIVSVHGSSTLQCMTYKPEYFKPNSTTVSRIAMQ